jgi:hypothetical protein
MDRFGGDETYEPRVAPPDAPNQTRPERRRRGSPLPPPPSPRTPFGCAVAVALAVLAPVLLLLALMESFSSWDNPDVSYETSTGTAAVFAVLAGVCGLSALVVGAGALVVWGRRIARASLPAGSGVRARYVAAWLLWSALLLAIVVIGVEYIDHQAGFSLIGFPAPYSW